MSSQIRPDVLLEKVVYVVLFHMLQTSPISFQLNLLESHCPGPLIPSTIMYLPGRMRRKFGNLEKLLVPISPKRLLVMLRVLSPFYIFKLLLRLP